MRMLAGTCGRYELATLRSPFYSEGVNFYVLGKRIMSRKFEPICGYSPALADLVDRMLRLDAADRLSAAEVFELASASTPT